MFSAVKRDALRIVTLFCLLVLVSCCLCSCEAFVRKFTRKSDKAIKTEEPIFEPETYPDASANKDALYKDYFLFWETWSEELLSFLDEGENFKKQKECAEEALDNLTKMQSLLSDERGKALEVFVCDFKEIKEEIFKGGLSSVDFYSLKRKVQRIRSSIHHNFIFSKINKDLK